MTEIRFYHLQKTTIAQSLPLILEKALQGDYRTLILVRESEQLKPMSDALWSYKPQGFLPHAFAGDKHADDAPILLAAYDDFAGITIENTGKTMLVLTDAHDLNAEQFESYDLCCEMLNGHNQKEVEAGRKRWAAYKDTECSISYWAQDDQGRWSQKA